MRNTSDRKVLHIDRVNPSPLWNYKQEDDGVLLLSIYKGGQTFEVTGQTITLGIKNSKGQLIEHKTGITISGSNVDIVLSNSIFAVKGKLECDLILKDSAGQMSTATFYLMVGQKVLGENNILSTNIVPTIDKIANDFETRSNKLIDDVTKDYCTLQKVIIDENASANLQNQINDVNSSLDNIDTKVGFLDKLKLKFVYNCNALGGAVKNEMAIYNLIVNESTIYIPNGIYEIDSKILVENLDNKTLIIEDNAIFNVNMTNEMMINDFNVFEFKNCKNIKVCGGKCVNTNTTTKVGYVNKGAFIKLLNVDTFEIEKTYAENTPYNILVFSGCINGKIHNNQAINKPTGAQCGMSGIMVNGASFIKVYENDILGCFRDGMLSIFGGASYEIRVYENRVISYFDRYNFEMMQGITVDQGPLNTRVYNNYVEACYYGIDVKAETKHTKVYNNTIANCKVGVSDRQGEATSVVQSYDTEVYDNLIYIDNTDLIKESYIFQPSGAYAIGIHSADRYGSNIYDNTIIYKAPKQITFCGIYLLGKSSMSSIYSNLYNIKRNKIVLEYAFASNVFVPSDGSIGMYINSASAFIDDNTFVTGGTTRKFSSIKYKNCWGLQVINNLFKQLGITTICIECEDTVVNGEFKTSLNGVVFGNRCSSIENSTKSQLLNSGQDLSTWKVSNNIPWNI